MQSSSNTQDNTHRSIAVSVAHDNTSSDNTMPSFYRLPYYVASLMRKVDTVMEKLDRLISAPQEEADQYTVLDIREASELLGKTVGTIYSLTSQRRYRSASAATNSISSRMNFWHGLRAEAKPTSTSIQMKTAMPTTDIC